jgi:hypothetical protein
MENTYIIGTLQIGYRLGDVYGARCMPIYFRSKLAVRQIGNILSFERSRKPKPSASFRPERRT